MSGASSFLPPRTISSPLLDHADLGSHHEAQIEVPRVEVTLRVGEKLSDGRLGEPSACLGYKTDAVRLRVEAARARTMARKAGLEARKAGLALAGSDEIQTAHTVVFLP